MSDAWEGLETFLTPEEELLIVRTSLDVIAGLSRSDEELARLARRTRERTLEEHTADERVKQLETICSEALGAEAVHTTRELVS